MDVEIWCLLVFWSKKIFASVRPINCQVRAHRGDAMFRCWVVFGGDEIVHCGVGSKCVKRMAKMRRQQN